MRNIIKITCLSLVFWMAGCTGKFETYNTDPYNPTTVSPAGLMEKMMNAMMPVQQNESQQVDQMVGSLGGYFTVANRWGGQNFDTFNASDAWNAEPYKLMFAAYATFFEVEKSTQKSGHLYAMARLLRAAVMMRAADCYGPIPYSKVANGTFYVEYDKNEDVYKYIIEDLAEAASILYAYSQQYPTSRPLTKDPIYASDYQAWVRFANSMRLRAAIRSNNQEAAESACAHAGGMIETNSQNAMRNPGVQGNPYQLAATSWGDLRVNASIVDYMTGYNDPRLAAYFQKSTFDNARYIGMRAGTAVFAKSDVANYSVPNLQSGSYLPLFVAAETNFLRAEAALRGWAVPGTAQSNYEAGVQLSMTQYGIEADAIATYLADEVLTPGKHIADPLSAKYNYDRQSTVKIKWNDGDSNEQNLERIITQKWIANYPMGLEAWAEFRRTGYPELSPTIDNLGKVITNNARGMRRLRYPYTEKSLNRTNYDGGVVLLGGKDDESVDLFWTKKN